MRPYLYLLMVVLVIVSTGCGEDAEVVLASGGRLSLSQDLQSSCYSWPEQRFSPENVAKFTAALPVDAMAVEFSLRDLEGNSYKLSTLLETKPVLLILGSFT